MPPPNFVQRGEQPEKEKHIAYRDTVFLKVRLSPARLAESATAVLEHRVVVAEMRPRESV